MPIQVTTIGSPERQQAFLRRHAAFFENLDEIMAAENAAFDRTLEAVSEIDPVIFYLGIRSVRDFNAIALLCANDDALPASALVRGMYERVVTAAYLHEHPDQVTEFLDYDYVQRFKVARLVKEAIELEPDQKAQFDQLEKDYQSVREKFLITDCNKCKTQTVGSSWSKLSFVAMAAKVRPLDALLVPAYYVPLYQAHSTLKSISSLLQGNASALEFKQGFSADADETFRLAYLLLVHVFKIQAMHFKLAPIEATTRTVIDRYVSICGEKSTGNLSG